MVQLTRLPQPRSDRVDHVVLGRLQHALGPARSREVVSNACFEIVERLTRFEVAVASNDPKEAGRLARAVAAMSDEIGLLDLGAAALAAADSQRAGDAVACAATAQRLMRVGEASLDALMECSGARQN